MKKFIILPAAILATALLFGGAVIATTAEREVEVEFGREHSGSPFPPDAGHDQSGHGRDGIIPRTVVIERGESIEFEIYPFHRPAIYRPGTTPEDIDTGADRLTDVSLPCVPEILEDFNIDDPEGRVAYAPPQSCEEQHWETPEGTFDEPGRYLMICATLPHFQIGMYGWIIVK